MLIQHIYNIIRTTIHQARTHAPIHLHLILLYHTVIPLSLFLPHLDLCSAFRSFPFTLFSSSFRFVFTLYNNALYLSLCRFLLFYSPLSALAFVISRLICARLLSFISLSFLIPRYLLPWDSQYLESRQRRFSEAQKWSESRL